MAENLGTVPSTHVARQSFVTLGPGDLTSEGTRHMVCIHDATHSYT